MKPVNCFITILINALVTLIICILFIHNKNDEVVITPTDALTIWASVITIVFVVFSFLGIYNIDAKVKELNHLRDKQEDTLKELNDLKGKQDDRFRDIEDKSQKLIGSIEKVKADIVSSSEAQIQKIVKTSFIRQSFFDQITKIAVDPIPYRKITHYTKILRDTKKLENFDAGFVYINRGYAYMQMGRFDKAKNDFETAIEVSTEVNKASAHNALGGYYVTKKMYPESIGCFKKALEYENDSPLILMDIGNSYSAMRQFDEAKKYYDKVLTIDPDFAQAYYNIAKLQIDETGASNVQTMSYLKKCVDIDPSFVPAYINMAELKKEQNKFDEAINIYDDVIGKPFADDLVMSILQRGETKRLQCKYFEALSDFYFVFTFRPSNIPNILNLSASNFGAKHLDEAIYFAQLGLKQAEKQNNHQWDNDLNFVLENSKQLLEAIYKMSQPVEKKNPTEET